MASAEFFAANPDYRHAVLDFYFNEISCQFVDLYAQTPPHVLNSFVKSEFSSDEATLAAYLFGTVNLQRLQLAQLQAES